jgi:putative ABC transport system ATP-binding protein
VPDRELAVEEISVSFGSSSTRTFTIRDLSLSFEPGRLTLVTGPSGSGKTTLLSVLGALLRPDSGKVFVGGEEIGRLDEVQRTRLRRDKIGFIFQAFRLFHSLTAFENVMIASDVAGLRDQKRCDAAVQLLGHLGLADKAKLKPNELSGGEKQRVAIARALLRNPSILLADEPTASLDSVAGTRICEIMKSFCEERQYTTVVVSHDARWMRFASRVVVLEDGRVVEDRMNKG